MGGNLVKCEAHIIRVTAFFKDHDPTPPAVKSNTKNRL